MPCQLSLPIIIIYLVALAAANTNASIIVTPEKNYSTASPTWLTSPYFRADSKLIISTLTGSGQYPFASFTFTYSSALPNIPNLAYGIKKYSGDDFLMSEFFEIRMTGLTASTFSVEVQLFGTTNIWFLAVAYIAVDPTFPHHLNSFDNVPVNYTAGNIVNLTSKSSGMTYYTNYINYTQQASGRQFFTFTQPLSGNHIVLFLTSLWVEGTSGDPFRINVYPQIINSSHYMWNFTLYREIKLTNVHFSQIIFNSDDVEATEKYSIVFEKWYNDEFGGFIQIPIEFVDNFMVGLISFEMINTHCIIDYHWLFDNQTVSGNITFGVTMKPSVPVKGSCALARTESYIFYMMTWQCDPPYYYFNLTTRECQTFCGAFYIQNPSNRSCIPCQNSKCYQCDANNTFICTSCDSDEHYELVGDECACMDGYYELNSTCLLCELVNIGCEICNYDHGGNSSAIVFDYANYTCLTCNNSIGYWLNSSTQRCSPKCGDGVLISTSEDCDDGNNQDYDGCSQTCIIQSHFSCSGSPSICLFTSNVSVNLLDQLMNSLDCNILTFELGFSPASDVFKHPDINWSNFVSSPNNSLIVKQPQFYIYSNNSLRISYFLLADMQNQSVTLSFDFSTLLPGSPIFSNSLASDITFIVDTIPPALMGCCSGFFVNTTFATCDQICGDGILYDLPCDDGNLIDGDGCSSSCDIESGYDCMGGSPSTASVCAQEIYIDPSLKYGDKDPHSNSMILTYTIDHIQDLMRANNESTDFTTWISFPQNSGVSVTHAYIDLETGYLMVIIDYTEDLQDNKLTLHLTAPNTIQALGITNSTYKWIVDPTNQLKAVVYSKDLYSQRSRLNTMTDALMYILIIAVILTAVYRRMLGLQIATLFQLGYLSLLMNKEITVWAQPITTWLYVFGYNKTNFFILPMQRFSSPYHIYHYQALLGYSNNVMVLIIVSLYVLGGIIFGVSKATQKGTADRLRWTAQILICQIGFVLLAISSPNLLTGFCLEIRYGVMFNWSNPLSKLLLLTGLLEFVFGHFLNIYLAQQNYEVGTFLKKEQSSAVFLPTVHSIRLLILTLLIFLYISSSTFSAYAAILIQIVYCLYIIIARPHLKKRDFIRSLFIEIGLLVILMMRIMEIQLVAELVPPRSGWFAFMVYFQYVIYFLCILLTFISVFLHLLTQFRSSNKVIQASNQSCEKIFHETSEDINCHNDIHSQKVRSETINHSDVWDQSIIADWADNISHEGPKGQIVLDKLCPRKRRERKKEGSLKNTKIKEAKY